MRYLFLCLFCVVSIFSSKAYACDEEAVCSHAITVFGEPKYEKGFTHFEYVNPNAPKGGEIKFASIGTFDNLNPYILKGIAAAGISYTADTLLVASGDEPFTKYGLIAQTIELAKDHSWVGFYLHPDAKWHDGTPITAEDIRFSFDTITKEGHPFYRSYYSDIQTVEVVANDHIRFHFKNTNNRELPLIIGDLPIISKAYYSENDFSKTSLSVPLSNGPYKIEKLDAGKFIRYKRVENYWAKDLPVNKGRYNFDVIQYDYYRDATVALEALKAGEYDVRQENIAKNWHTAYDFPAKQKGEFKQEMIDHDIPAGMQGLVFNTRLDKFKDRRVREAIALTMDFEWMNRTLFFGSYTRSDSYFSNSIYANEGLPTKAELALLEPWRKEIPEAVFTTHYEPPVTAGTGNVRPQLRKAKRLLEAAGWKVKGGVLTHDKTGEVMEIEFLLNSPTFERVMASIVKNLKILGVSSTIRTVDNAQYVKRVEQFDFDMVFNVFGQSNFPGNEQMDYWHSSVANTHGSRNLIGIQNPAVDKLVEGITTASSMEDLKNHTKALDRILLHEHYVIPNWYLGKFRVAYWDRFGRPEKTPPYTFAIDSWWIK